MAGRCGSNCKGNVKKDAILGEYLVLAVVELAELEEKTVTNFAVEGRGGIPMNTVVTILPEKNHLGEDESDESFCPDLAIEFLVTHVEVSVVCMLKVGPVATEIATEELIPADLCLALACIVEG